MDEISRREIGRIIGFITTVSLGSLGLTALESALNEYFGTRELLVPRTTTVAEGYVVPSKLEVSCLEADSKEPCKTVVTYEGKKFLLRYDGSHITGSPYEVKPVQ